MGFLTDKKILITGLLSNRSIAYGVAKACQREGATLAFSYAGEGMKERVAKLAADFAATPLLYACDVTRDEEIAATFDGLAQEWGSLDGFLHAIAFAPREAIAGDFLSGASRENFRIAHDVSAYSLAALTRAARPLLTGHPASVVALTYLGAERAVPNYNTMGVAKAALEASVRYLATDLGREGIRVNGISAGPIKTLAASGIAGFGKMLKHVANASPIRRNVTVDDVGNVAAFLFSELSVGITGEITYVDGGYRNVAAGMADEEPSSPT
ncbi:MAG: hypothetical protein RLZZ502_1009 [Pseudomonadota bacterium]|jgi:enoyl-[acyl-carrier protein] reductase I